MTSRLILDGSVVCIPGGIQAEGYCWALVDRAIDSLGGLDILVANAAFQTTHAELEDFSTGRAAQPVELTPFFVVFLASNDALFVTGGSTVRPDGRTPANQRRRRHWPARRNSQSR